MDISWQCRKMCMYTCSLFDSVCHCTVFTAVNYYLHEIINVYMYIVKSILERVSNPSLARYDPLLQNNWGGVDERPPVERERV